MTYRRVWAISASMLLIGLAIAAGVDMEDLQAQTFYPYIPAGLLAVGLYAATYDIDMEALRQQSRLVIEAITIGVFVKALYIGGLMALIFREPFYFILGLSVAQIDPLVVTAFEADSKLSPLGKTILRAVAALDDPVTVLLTLYVPYLVQRIWGASALAAVVPLTGLGDYAVNVVFAAVAFYVWRLVRLWRPAQHGWPGAAFAAGVVAAGAYWFWMLGVALVGLDIRPHYMARLLAGTIRIAFFGTVLLLGTLLHAHYTLGSLVIGLVLGTLAYTAQMVVAPWLTRRLPRADRIYLAFAQQNGITAIILSLLLEPLHPGAMAIVATAIVVVGVWYEVCNRLVVPHFVARCQVSAE